MTDEQETKHAFAHPCSDGGLGILPVAWRRLDTPRTVITENEDTVCGWKLDGLFFEALVPKDVSDTEILRLRQFLVTIRDTGLTAGEAAQHAGDALMSNIKVRGEAMEWQPIKTAPKDETVIDIYTPEHGIGRCVYMSRVDLGKGNIFYEQTQGGYSCIRTATHWMPLPEDPNVKLTSGAPDAPETE